MDFEAWIAEIQDTVTFVVEPRDAIAQHVTDEDV